MNKIINSVIFYLYNAVWISSFSMVIFLHLYSFFVSYLKLRNALLVFAARVEVLKWIVVWGQNFLVFAVYTW